MHTTVKIGVLLTNRTTGEKIGVIEFEPSGILITHVFRSTVHVFTLTPLVQILREPLYVKHSLLMKKCTRLPVDILQREAGLFADELNRSERSVTVGKYTLRAEVVYSRC